MGVANNFGCFFLSGLPGGLDFALLVLVRRTPPSPSKPRTSFVFARRVGVCLRASSYFAFGQVREKLLRASLEKSWFAHINLWLRAPPMCMCAPTNSKPRFCINYLAGNVQIPLCCVAVLEQRRSEQWLWSISHRFFGCSGRWFALFQR